MGQRRHGVEGMGKVIGSGFQRGIAGIAIRVGMADGNGNARRAQRAHAVQAAGHFGGQRDQPQGIAPGQQKTCLRGQDGAARLRAFLGRVDKGPLGMAAQRPRTVKIWLGAFGHKGADGFKRARQLLPGHRHGGGQEGCNAVLQDAARHAAQAVQAAVGGVLAQISMNMHVHKTRGNVQPLRVNGFAVRGHGIA